MREARERSKSLVAAIAGTASIALLGVLVAGPAATQAVAPNPNPWLQKRFLNIAHQGGEDEAPSNTLFAHKSAVATRGADSIELDVNLSEDGELMVIHDDTLAKTTNGPQFRDDAGDASSEIDQMTVAEIQAFDAGYWFRPGSYSHDPGIPAGEFIYRGMRSGTPAPPAGYSQNDFRIPTLREVLDAFPTTPINIEIKLEKSIGGSDGGCVTEIVPYCDDADDSEPVALELADVLDEPQYEGRQDIIVVSFSDQLIETFHTADSVPQTPLAPGLGDTQTFAFSGTAPNPDVAAFQVPPKFAPGVDTATIIMTGRNAHGNGYAVHVWPNGQEPENETSYARMVTLGVDGYMASEPQRLHNYLCTAGVRRPDGSARCPAQITPTPAAATPTAKCKKGKKLKKGTCVKKKRKKGKKRR